jgi:WD40 repeat protein
MAEAQQLDAANPWPGLASFAESDRPFFRGRENEADELARLVRRERLTVLFGRSGLGKSSLLHAGLFPRLREDGHLPVVLRLGFGAGVDVRSQVWDALAAACTAAQVTALQPLAGQTLWEYFHREGGGFWHLGRRPRLPVLVFDQFEELFTLGRRDAASLAAAQAWFDELADLVEDRPPAALRERFEREPALVEQFDIERRGCKVVLSFREDFLAEFEGLRGRMPSLMRNRFRLLPMSGEQARAVVASGGSLVPPEVGDRIIGLAWRNRADAPAADDFDRVEIDPALLSVICRELNLRRQSAAAAQIEASLLTGAGAAILTGFYERAFEGLDPRVRAFVEDELITAAGYRDSFAVDDALVLPGVDAAAIDGLVVGRLLRIDERFGARRLELTHDVLTRVVKDSRDARRAREAEAEAAAREAQAMALLQRNRRTARWVMAGIALAVVLLATSAVTSWHALEQRSAASQARQEAAAQTLLRAQEVKAAEDRLLSLRRQAEEVTSRAAAAASAAETQAAEASAAAARQIQRAVAFEANALGTDLMALVRSLPDRALAQKLLLGAEVLRRQPERRDAQLDQMMRLVRWQRWQRLLASPGPETRVHPTPDRRVLVQVTSDGALAHIDPVRLRVVARWPAPMGAGLRVEQVSNDGRVIVASGNSQELLLLRLHDGGRVEAHVLTNDRFGVSAVLAPDGTRVALRDGGQIHVLTADASGPPRPLWTQSRPGGLDCIAFDPARRTLMAAGSEPTQAWSDTDGAPQRPPQTSTRLALSSADCRSAVVEQADGKGQIRLRLVDLATGEAGATVYAWAAGKEKERPSRIEYLPGGHWIRAEVDGKLQLWPVPPPGAAAAESFRIDDDYLGTSAASPDGRWTAASFDRGEIVIQQWRPVRQRFTMRPPERALSVAFAPDSKSLLAVTQEGGLQALALDLPPPLASAGRAFEAGELDFDPSGRWLLARGDGADDDMWRLWDLDRGLGRPLPKDTITARFSADGGHLLAVRQGETKEAVLWRVEGDFTPLAVLSMEGDRYPYAMDFDAARRRWVVGHADAIVLFDAIGSPARAVNFGREYSPKALAFHPSQPGWIAGVFDQGEVAAYNLAAGRQLWSRPAPGRRQAVSLLADPRTGHWLVGHSDGSVDVLEPRSGRVVATLAVDFDRHVYTAVLRPNEVRRRPDASALRLADQGRILMAGELGRAKEVYDLERRQWIGSLDGRHTDFSSVAFADAAQRGALLRDDRSVTLFDWRLPTLQRDACRLAGRNLGCDEWRAAFGTEPWRKTCPEHPAPVPACAASQR